jgi:hypothetical protein
MILSLADLQSAIEQYATDWGKRPTYGYLTDEDIQRVKRVVRDKDELVWDRIKLPSDVEFEFKGVQFKNSGNSLILQLRVGNVVLGRKDGHSCRYRIPVDSVFTNN